MSKRRIWLPNKLGRLLVPKNADMDKLKKKYPEDKFSLTTVLTSEGTPIGFLLKKIKKKAEPCPTCGATKPKKTKGKKK